MVSPKPISLPPEAHGDDVVQHLPAVDVVAWIDHVGGPPRRVLGTAKASTARAVLVLWEDGYQDRETWVWSTAVNRLAPWTAPAGG